MKIVTENQYSNPKINRAVVCVYPDKLLNLQGRIFILSPQS